MKTISNLTNGFWERPGSEPAEKLSIRIGVCLQAYRESLKMVPASSRWGSMFLVQTVFCAQRLQTLPLGANHNAGFSL
jgi:hypothetical protein